VDQEDRRSFTIKLTPKGSAAFEQMAKVHEGWIIDFFAGLSSHEKDLLYSILTRLKDHLIAKEAK
jgi:DNA-binding MarR family transcriptional regulator